MDALNYWWNKYMILRDLKNEYLRKSKEIKVIGKEQDLLDKDYLDRLIEAIK